MPIQLHTPSLAPERDIAVLRLLGRFEKVVTTTIHDLLGGANTLRTSQRLLARLEAQRLIWRTTMPNGNRDERGRSRGSAPDVFGLTDDGQRLLENLGVEPQDGTFERLIYRSKQAPTAPLRDALLDDVYLSDWCASLIHEVFRTPALVGVQIQRRYTLYDNQGGVLQQLGALVILVFDPQRSPLDRPVHDCSIPWLSDVVPLPQHRFVAFALEYDAGLAPPSFIERMAQTYQRLTSAGVYEQTFGTPLRPVLLCPPGRRARVVADTWMRTWNGSPALITSIDKTVHREYGVLWGDYRALATNPVRPTTLLGDVLGTVEQWSARIAQPEAAHTP